MSKMDFKSFIIKDCLHEDTPLGDIARDVKVDKNFPKTKNITKILQYLINDAHASESFLKTYHEAFELYIFYLTHEPKYRN